jgi:GNAT superfamily N-acetyltransferase
VSAEADFSAFEFRTVEAAALSEGDREIIFSLFDVAYRQANHAYLEKSLHRLRYLAIAAEDGRPAGFALADARVIDLPRLPATTVILAGICCIDPAYRRRGLFSQLERLAAGAAGVRATGRALTAGRMAHPASYRLMSRNPAAVPRPDIVPTAWQQEVGAAVAEAYGVEAFDPATFVCRGSGVPIGYPVIEVDVPPEEWVVFRPVNRDRGDSLLGISWMGGPPEGW